MVGVAEARARDNPQLGPGVVGFVFQLELKRIALGLSQGAFAERLGVDRSVWYLIRQGTVRPTWSLINRVLVLWPGEFDRYLEELHRVWPR